MRPNGELQLTAAEQRSPVAQLNENLFDYDETMFDLARSLALESADGYPNGPQFWNDIADSFVGGLVARHTSESASASRGLAEIAAAAGFAYQSHLSRWARRVHGVSLRQFVRGRNEDSKNIHDRQPHSS